MPRMFHLWSTVLHPDGGESTRYVPNRPFDLDGPEARTQCTEFARTRRKLMKHEMQGGRQVRFKLDVRSGRLDLSAIRRVRTHDLLKQLSRLKLVTEVPPVIFNARRVSLFDRCFDRNQQISNSVIERGEQKSQAVSVQIELRRVRSHF